MWKNRWNVPSYKFATQCKIVVATLALHNFIRTYAFADVELCKCDQDPNYMLLVEEDDRDEQINKVDNSLEHGGALHDNDMGLLCNDIVKSLMSWK